MTVIVSQSEAAPSETHTSKVWAPTWAPLGVQLKSPAGGDRGARGHRAGAVGEREGERVARVGIAGGRGEGELAVGGGVLVADRVQGGRGVGRGHGDGDRLAVGGGAVGDAHVEGVGADLGAARRPAEGARAGDRGARGHRAGAVGEREGERVARVGIARGRGEGELAVGGGVLVADRVQGGRGVGRGHGDGDRLAVGGVAVGDAHVEGVGADLAGGRRPGEGARRR